MNIPLNVPLNTMIILTTKKKSKYRGFYDGIRIKQNKIHLSKLQILHKNGSFKTTSGNSNENKRWFNLESIEKIEVDETL